MSIDSELEPSTLDIRQRIDQIVEINPARHDADAETIVARRNSEEDNLLPRDVNPTAQQLRKKFRQPWTRRKHVPVGNDLLPRDCANRASCWWRDRLFAIINTDRSCLCCNCLHCTSRQQNTGIRLEHAPRNLPQRDLRKSSR